jgi:glutathione-specific gamma-glutamylcyclotransferase
MALTREQIRDGWVQQLVADADHPVRALSQEELEQSRAEVMAGHPQGQDVALFGYGSLIWNPAFHYARREVARIYGHHRSFCLWTSLGRGTAARPGLMLGLDTGGSCRGVLYTIAADAIASELEIVWRREMVTAAYRPCWVVAHTAGGPRRAIAFLINHAHERYAGRLDEATVAAAIASACGPLGACADYLFETTAHLDELGIVDRSLRRLRRVVRAMRQSAGGSGFALEGALVPAAQDNMLEQREAQEDQDAGQADQDQRREHAGNVEPVAGLEDPIGQA